MPAQEYVNDLEEFLDNAWKRKHWFLDEFFGFDYNYITLILSALDEKDHIIKYSKYFGGSDYDAPYEERKVQFEEIKKKAKKMIEKLPDDFSRGLWSISK